MTCVSTMSLIYLVERCCNDFYLWQICKDKDAKPQQWEFVAPLRGLVNRIRDVFPEITIRMSFLVLVLSGSLQLCLFVVQCGLAVYGMHYVVMFN